MLIIEFRLRKNVVKLEEKPGSWYVGHRIDHVYHSVLKEIRYSASQCYSVHVVYSARNVFVAQHKRSANFSIWSL